MTIENEHLDLLQNIEFSIVSFYRNHPETSDYDVMRALDALIGWYRAESRYHVQKPIVLEDLESEVLTGVKAVCEWRMGRGEPMEGLPCVAEKKS